MSLRRRFVVILAFALSIPVLPAWAADAPVWTQDASDVPADPAVLYGRLPNGMRYALMHNETPGKQASIRFRIGSGSLEETDAQQDLAHFLEHMAFKGSTHVPAGEMVKLLQRKGLAFGADTNAFTEWSQTVYALDLPETDDDMIDTGLMLMRETASELNLDAAAFEPERGVVLSEERLRDTPAYRAFAARLNLVLDGQLASRRLPIGQVDILQHAPVDLVRDYYHANYRPERATLIMIGDFDPAAVEAKIKARFSDWKPVGPSVAEPDLGTVKQRGTTAKVVEVKGASTQVQISFVHPFDKTPDSLAKRKHDLVEALAVAIINERLSKLLRSDDPPLLTATVANQTLFKSDHIFTLSGSAKADRWKEALATLDQEQRRIVEFGVTQDEIDRIVAGRRAALKQQVDGAATRKTTDLAGRLLANIGDGEVFTTPAENQELLEQVAQHLTVDQINASLKEIFTGQGPLIQLSAAAPIEGGDAALLAAYDAAHAVPITGQAAASAVAWPYASFGTPGTVADRHELVDAGATAVRFANGVALTVKPSKFRDDEVLVSARIGQGRLDFPAAQAGQGWAAGAFIEGGLDQIDRDDISRVFASKVVGLSFNVGDQSFDLSGTTRPQDLDSQLQLLAAYVAHPGFRPQAFERLRAYFVSTAGQRDATPSGVLSRDLPGLLHGGDPRWTFPTPDQLAAAKPEALKLLLLQALATAPIEVTIVGDVTVEDAIKQVAATFGALPPRPTATKPPAATGVRFPAPAAKPKELKHKGRSDQAIALVGWALTDYYADRDQADALDIADDILQFRLLEAVRIAEGATYSPQGEAIESPALAGFGYAISLVETPPDKIAAFYGHVETITKAMATTGVTADELERARAPRIEGFKKNALTNNYWLHALAGVQADPRKLDDIRRGYAGYEKVTANQVREVMKTYFRDDKAWKLVVLPTPGPTN